MIFYFSGTGNSQRVAEQLARITGDDRVFLNRLLREREAGTFCSERPLVFVSPTYAWRLPRIVEDWIRRARFEGNSDAYFVLSCGTGCGNAAAYARRLCAEKGLRFRGLAPVLMPENYLAMFSTPDAAQCREIIDRALPCIASLAESIRAGEGFPDRKPSLVGRLESGPINPLFYALCVRDSAFRSLEGCTGCGRCARTCPVNNIVLREGLPAWQGNCIHCMACIAGCPAGAIEYGSRSRGKHRHFILRDATERE